MSSECGDWCDAHGWNRRLVGSCRVSRFSTTGSCLWGVCWWGTGVVCGAGLARCWVLRDRLHSLCVAGFSDSLFLVRLLCGGGAGWGGLVF